MHEIELCYPTQKTNGLTQGMIDFSSETLKFVVTAQGQRKVVKLSDTPELQNEYQALINSEPSDEALNKLIALALKAYPGKPTKFQLGGAWVSQINRIKALCPEIEVCSESNDPITRINEMIENKSLPRGFSGVTSTQGFINRANLLRGTHMAVLGGPFSYDPGLFPKLDTQLDIDTIAKRQQQVRQFGNQHLAELNQHASEIAEQEVSPLMMSSGGSNPGFVYLIDSHLVTIYLRKDYAKGLVKKPLTEEMVDIMCSDEIKQPKLDDSPYPPRVCKFETAAAYFVGALSIFAPFIVTGIQTYMTESAQGPKL